MMVGYDLYAKRHRIIDKQQLVHYT